MALWEREGVLTDLRSRRNGVVLIAGEAGIGKSALVRAFAPRAVLGLCDPLATPRALGPWHDIGRRLGGALAERLAEGAGPADLLGPLLDAFQRPALQQVVIEDLHWADAASLDLLVLLARRIERLPLQLLLTYRDDELTTTHPLHGALAALPRDVTVAVHLQPLSAECVAEQARGSGRDPAEVFALTGGNPLLVTELLAGGDSTIRTLMLARLRMLPPSERDLAELLAVVPARADVILRGRPAPYRHELLRRAVEDALPADRRIALHRRAFEILREDPTVDPAVLVHHADRGGLVDALVEHGLRAAASAARQGAHREAVAHLRLVLPHTGEMPPAERAGLLEEFGEQAYLAGLSEEGLPARREAVAIRESLGDEERTGAGLRWVSRLAWWCGDTAEARAAASRAVEVLERAAIRPETAKRATPTADTPRRTTAHPASAERAAADTEAGKDAAPTVEVLERAAGGRELAMAYSNRSQLHMLADEHDAAIVWGMRAIGLAEQIGDRETTVHAEVNVASARLARGEPDVLLSVHERAAAEGFPDHAARALVNRATYTDDLAAVEPALAYARAHDLDGYTQYLLGVRAALRVENLDWDAALADADESLGRGNRIGVAVVPAIVAKARILSARGDPAALSTLDRALELALPTDEVQRIAPVAVARAEHFLFAGDTRRAALESDAGLLIAGRTPHNRYTTQIAIRRWLATGEGEPPAVDGLRPYSRLLAARTVDGLAALDAAGAGRAAAWLRSELRNQGVGGIPRAGTTRHAAGLTARQAEVLRLLADGLSNMDIARALTLSPKTVAHHVSAVLEKLAVPSRAQAAAVARKRGLV